MKTFIILASMWISIELGAKEQQPGKMFGEEIEQMKESQAQEVLASFEKYKDKTILLTVKVEKVCQKKGCWMGFKSGEQEVRVTFKDYSFFVPLNISGKQAKIQGIMHRKALSKGELEHYAKDENLSKEETEKLIKDKKFEFQFIASGVLLI